VFTYLVPIVGILLVHPAAAEDDPFTYCAKVGTIDAPDHRYTGPAMPAVIVRGLRAAFGAPADAPFLEHSVWRCMGGKVYACTVGANLPCSEKADTNRKPSTGMAEFCQGSPDASVIPAYVTGRATVYEWRCDGTKAVVEKQIAKVDARGYLAGIWYAISPER
jgi:hypothetical protein